MKLLRLITQLEREFDIAFYHNKNISYLLIQCITYKCNRMKRITEPLGRSIQTYTHTP